MYLFEQVLFVFSAVGFSVVVASFALNELMRALAKGAAPARGRRTKN